MHINYLKLLEYFKTIQEVTIETDLDDADMLIFTKGHWSQYGSTTVCVAFEQVKQILVVNKVRERIQTINDEFDTLEHRTEKQHKKREKDIDDILYITLTKYVTQMLNASLGKILYPEIVPLNAHQDFFRGDVINS